MKTRLLFLLISLAAVGGFVACGKSSGGGPAVIGPGLAGISNTCGPFGCFGASAGQQISRAQGVITYDDNLPKENRLMDIALTINVWQPSGVGPYSSAYGYPMGANNIGLGGNLLPHYNGPVNVQGQIQIVSPILNCNIPQGTFNVQPQGVGMLSFGALTVALGVNVNGGQGFTIMVEGLTVVPAGNFVMGGDARLVGVVRIPNCEDTTFRVE
jgi:hypothetical protein